jgi:hypothetical protein
VCLRSITAVIVGGDDRVTVNDVTRTGRQASVGVVAVAGVAVGLKLVIVVVDGCARQACATTVLFASPKLIFYFHGTEQEKKKRNR